MSLPSRFTAITLAPVALGWLIFGVFGHRLASLIAGRAANAIGRMAKGKVADPAVFIYGRAFDALWLATILILLVLVFLRLGTWLARRSFAPAWISQSLLAFILLNVWVGAAMQRPLFWTLLYSGEGSSNFTQFKLKETLMAEAPPIPQAVLLGSSQVRAQIDENLLNRELSNRLWTTELHFPGSVPLDIALVSRHLRKSRAEFFISYISEGSFFSGPSYNSLPYFTTFRDLPWFQKLGATTVYRQRGWYVGLLGSISPLFRSRESIAQRLLGKSFTALKQAQYNRALETNLVHRAEEALPGIKSTPYSQMQKRAFNAFLEEAAGQKRRVILLVGQYNPVLGQRLDPTLRREMLDFLHEMARKHPHLTLVENVPFLQNPAEDYLDLTHVSEDAQRRFTLALADFLRSTALKQN